MNYYQHGPFALADEAEQRYVMFPYAYFIHYLISSKAEAEQMDLVEQNFTSCKIVSGSEFLIQWHAEDYISLYTSLL